MNDRQKKVIGVTFENEKQILRLLTYNYRMAMDDIDAKIAYLLKGESTPSKRMQIQYQESLKKQIDIILDNMQKKNYQSVDQYLKDSYENGFIGTIFDLQGQGIPLVFPIEQEQVLDAMIHDTKLSKKLYEAMGEDVDVLKATIGHTLSIGIARSLHPDEISKMIHNRTGIGIGRSMTIARTEGQRIIAQATTDAQVKAKASGADIVKQWDSTLDKKTRPTHKELDGQIQEIGDDFVIPSSGRKAPHPLGFGVAKEDINCRCALLQRARWALDDEEFTKMNGDTNQLVNLTETDYDKFKTDYKKTVTPPVVTPPVVTPPDTRSPLKRDIDEIKKEVVDMPTEDQLHRAGKRLSDEYMDAHDASPHRQKFFELTMEKTKVADQVNKIERELDRLRQEMFIAPDAERDLLRVQFLKLKQEQEDIRKAWSPKAKELVELTENKKYDDALILKKKLEEVRDMGEAEFNLKVHLESSRSPMRPVIEKAYSVYPTSWIEKSIDYGTLTPKTVDRGYYSRSMGTIAISKGVKMGSFGTAIHELGHRFEHIVPNLLKVEKEFYIRRTAGSPLTWLGSGYDKSEKSRFDDFISKYMGKDYSETAYELVSMGFEMMYTNPSEFFMKDPDMAEWILGILVLMG